MVELHAIVKGRVQFVMFRDFVQRHARSLHLVGVVRNLNNGTVEVVAQGDRYVLDRLITDLNRGSLLARVDAVEVTWRDAVQMFKGFTIGY